MPEPQTPSLQAMELARQLCPSPDHKNANGDYQSPGYSDIPCICQETAAALDAYAAEHCGADVKYERLEAERDAAIARTEAAEARLAAVLDYLPACIRDISLPECTNRDHVKARDALNAKAAADPSEGGKE